MRSQNRMVDVGTPVSADNWPIVINPDGSADSGSGPTSDGSAAAGTSVTLIVNRLDLNQGLS